MPPLVDERARRASKRRAALIEAAAARARQAAGRREDAISPRSRAAPASCATSCASSCARTSPTTSTSSRRAAAGSSCARRRSTCRHPPRRAVRSDEGDGADVGDADGRRHLRLRPQPAGPRRVGRDAVRQAAVGVRLSRGRRSCICRGACPTHARRTSRRPRRARSSASSKRRSGRAFVLFTSYAALRAIQAIAEIELPYPILVQGSAPRSALLEQFRTTPNAVLLATSSFWQGVDVDGRCPELRDHRQAAVCVARRPDYGRPDRGDRRAGRRSRSANTRCRWPSSRCCRGWAA